jgi:hypothetical protein
MSFEGFRIYATLINKLNLYANVCVVVMALSK